MRHRVIFSVLALITVMATTTIAENRSDFLNKRIDHFLQNNENDRLDRFLQHAVNRFIRNDKADTSLATGFAIPLYVIRSLAKDENAVVLDKLASLVRKLENQRLTGHLFPEPLHSRWRYISDDQMTNFMKWIEDNTPKLTWALNACTFHKQRGEFSHLIQRLNKINFEAELDSDALSVLNCYYLAQVELNLLSEAQQTLNKMVSKIKNSKDDLHKSILLTSRYAFHFAKGDHEGLRSLLAESQLSGALSKGSHELSLAKTHLLDDNKEQLRLNLRTLERDHAQILRVAPEITRLYRFIESDAKAKSQSAPRLSRLLALKEEQQQLNFSHTGELFDLLVNAAYMGDLKKANEVAELIYYTTQYADQKDSINGIVKLWLSYAAKQVEKFPAEVTGPFFKELGEFSKFTIDLTLALRKISEDKAPTLDR